MATRKSRRSSGSSRGSSRSSGGEKKQRRAVKAGFRGAKGLKELEKEKKRQEDAKERRQNQTNAPFRYRLKQGETGEFIVVDDQEADLFFQYEHNIQNPDSGYWDIFTGCIKETDNCPVCESQKKESYFALYLTVIDLREFEDRKGKVHKFSRKLMPVKTGQIGKFLRRMEREGTLRGALFEASRDGDRDPQIGNDLEFIEMVPEDELETYTRSWKDKDGKTHHENCSEVYDYDELFPEPTKESLEELVGSAPTPGSSRQARQELEDEEDAEPDEEEWEDEEDEGEWDGEEEGDEEEEEEPPFDTDEEEEEAEEDEPEEEEEQPRRRSRGGSGRKSARRKSSSSDSGAGKARAKSKRRTASRGSSRRRR